MKVSTRSLHAFGFLLFTAAAVGCAQPGVSDLALPISPSTVSAGPSRSLQSSEIATVGPGAAYDASGSWHYRSVISSISGEVFFSDEGDIPFTADSDGNLHAGTEQEGTVTLLRRGKGLGQKITYAMSIFEPSSSGCPEDLSGHAQIDVATNTLTARVTGVLEGCSDLKVVIEITATKNGV